MRGSPPGPTRISTEWGRSCRWRGRRVRAPRPTRSRSRAGCRRRRGRRPRRPPRQGPADDLGRPLGEVSTATFEAVRTALVISSSGRLSAETTTASSHGARHGEGERDRRCPRQDDQLVAIDAAQQGARHPEEAGVTGREHAHPAGVLDRLAPHLLDHVVGVGSDLEHRGHAGRGSCPRLPTVPAAGRLATTTSASVRARRASGPRRSRRSSATPTTVTGLRSGTAPRSARPTRTAGGVVRRGPIRARLRPGGERLGGPERAVGPVVRVGRCSCPGLVGSLVRELGPVEFGVEPVASKQLGVCAALDDAPGVDHEQLVRLSHRRERWAITSDVRPASVVRSAAWTAASDSESRWAVASSNTTTSGALSSSRARARAASPRPRAGSRGRRRACRCRRERVDEGQDLGLGENGTDLLVAGVGLRVEEVRPPACRGRGGGPGRRRPRCPGCWPGWLRARSTPFSRTAPSFTS